MLAIFFGGLLLLLGFILLLLPLLVAELSRPRDSLMGAIVLVLGLVLITSSDQFTGSLLIAVISGSLIVSRLVYEVAQSRWQQLSKEEKERLASLDRWLISMQQMTATLFEFGGVVGGFFKIALPRTASTSKKKWVRPEPIKQEVPLKQAEITSHETLHNTDDNLQESLQKDSEGNLPSKD